MNIFNTKNHLRTQVLQQLVASENSCVEVVQRERDLRTMPYHGNNFASATKEQLNALIGKYVKDLKGIVLGYHNIKILSKYALIDDDGLNNFPIRADFYVFKPIPGTELPATVTKTSKDHVGCLIYNTFNMSIPKPEGVTNWTGNKVEIGEEVIARVTYVKLESRIPYIKGEFLEKSKVNRKIKFTDDGDIQDKEKSVDEESSLKNVDETEIDNPKKKKSRKSKKNECNDDKMIDQCQDKVKNEPISVESYDSVKKKKKKSRKSQENGNDEMVCVESQKNCLTEVKNETVSEVEDVLVHKKKSRRSFEIDEDMENHQKSKKRKSTTIIEEEGQTKKRKMA